MKLFETMFSFTPDDDTAGEGLITVEAESQEAAEEAIKDLLSDVPDLRIVSVREIVEIPEDVELTPRTLQ